MNKTYLYLAVGVLAGSVAVMVYLKYSAANAVPQPNALPGLWQEASPSRRGLPLVPGEEDSG